MNQFKELYFKYRLIIWPICSAIASLIILAFVIAPQILGFMNTQGQISKLESQKNSLEAKAAQLETIDEEVMRRDLQVAFTILPPDQDVPKAIVILQEYIKKSGLLLKSTDYIASSNRSSGKGNFLLNVTVGGTLSSIRNFLIILQEAPRLYQVDAIVARFQAGESTVEAEIPITVLFEEPPSSLGPVDQPVPELSDSDKELLKRLAKFTATMPSEGTTSAVTLGKSNPFE